MCGLITVLNHRALNPPNYRGLLDQIQHRGPDAEGLSVFNLESGNKLASTSQNQAQIALGHRRLAILDLDVRSDQPFHSNDGRYVLVYNGEIYNYIELREELKGLNCEFKTEGDVEVALQALIFWGPDIALNKFQGMFALSLFDRATGDLIIARDQLGIKPLFWTYWDGGIAWASEIWPLLSLPGVSRDANTAKIAQFCISGGQIHDGTSFFKDISRVESGTYQHVATRLGADMTAKRYWTLEVQNDGRPAQEMQEQFDAALLKNVARHLRSDVPIGVALSGGLDSSTLVGIIRHLEPDIEIKTFSFIPGDPSWSEERWIDMCNAHVDGKPHKVQPDPGDLVEDLPQLLRAQGEPFGTTSIYAQFRVMKLAADAGVKVMLDGQGADELLAGYAPYVSARALSLLMSGRPAAAAKLLYRAPGWVASSHRSAMTDFAKYLTPTALNQILRRRAASQPPFDWLRRGAVSSAQLFSPGAANIGFDQSFLKRTLREATTLYGLPDLLRYEDRNSMHFSLESRVPFLTAEFAEICMSLPERTLIEYDGRTKAALRNTANRYLPRELAERRDKIGFRPDVAGMNRPIVQAFLERFGNLQLPPDIDWDVVKTRLERLEGSDWGNPWVWRVINLAFWYDLAQRHPRCVKMPTAS